MVGSLRRVIGLLVAIGAVIGTAIGAVCGAASDARADESVPVPTAAEPAAQGPVAPTPVGVGWPVYGGDDGGSRYSALTDIGPENVARLELLWVHRTGDLVEKDGTGRRSETAYQLTPILFEGLLYGCSPWNKAFALDPETGAERWAYDPGLDKTIRWSNQAVCRGVTAWRDGEAAQGATCAQRIFMGTNDARLIALDARTGRPCADFGREGAVDLTAGVGELEHPGEYQVTSAPALYDDFVIVGAGISDNQRTDAPSGVVRAFDARTGALRWAWDPYSGGATESGGDDTEGAAASGDRAATTEPSGADGATAKASEDAQYELGTANVWAPMSVDVERDLVFLPTGNTAPDFYGGTRAGTDAYASSVVALRASTGEVVWHFQTVHHDLWDYDVPAQPTLTTIDHEGARVPVVVQATKMGFVFVLHRETGVPVFPVEERPVPTDGVPGERISPTQPFPTKPPPLVPLRVDEDDAWGVAFFDRRGCRKRIAELRHDGIYTPPTLQGTVMVPGNGGGSNWGGVAIDPARQRMIANVSNLPFVVTLFPADEFAARRAAEPGVEISPQRGTPYGMRREPFLSGLGLPCVKPPWGMLTAVDLRSGEILWQQPHGSVRELAPIPIPWTAGTPTLGGPLVTASGLVFIGATMDHYLRAYDAATGDELWKGRLEAPGMATPMTLRTGPGGRQIVVIAAGGHARAGTRLGDTLVAFALPD